MIVTKEDLAKRLNGREYASAMDAQEKADAIESGLCVISGASDDLVDFDGAFYEEGSAYEGAKLYLTPDGKIKNKPKEDRIEINAEWCPSDLDCSWRITASVPFAAFDVFEDGELFCRGCIIEYAPKKGATNV